MLVNFYITAYESSIRPADAFVVIETTFENEPIYFYKKAREDLVFYAHRCIPLLRNKTELDEVVKRQYDFILYIREKDISTIEGLQKGILVPLQSITGENSYLVEIEKSDQ
jgi:hypothetical protein